MVTANELRQRHAGRSAQPAEATRACAISLIDRRTGSVHRVNGAPLTVFSRNPAEAAADLLRHRDASLWDVRIDTIPAGAP
ncbi:MAG: hypothetical protein Q27BPR15_15690 [Rhodobacter sp. CACIA14H1]|nr:MAG: hypothetical protein Q27BPR15_15690 [Rhodobacter sp. CACIA14H1]